ncbi:DUF2092 domain-containing protein [Bradyrhizobium sp. SHOUNA76]|uniref:DUF2092 domain-containing protein n=1 Tax=Bradyrhizobium sp. SHOUNA76 TaxID=2908927 RepID=UPI001FF0EE4D|nr:DUF2092 domain-containing protein [Bradyrhizobium sp. SHOUNA76]MCJ9699494.1 DUF2092 domain-containing protein [Bradyrhizobium sp. SHOUNA76]
MPRPLRPADDPAKFLKSTTDYLGAQNTLSAAFDSDIEVITPELQKIQFASSGQLKLSRPDKLRVRRTGGYANIELIYDGKAVSLYGNDAKSYIQAEAPGTVDQMIATMQASSRGERTLCSGPDSSSTGPSLEPCSRSSSDPAIDFRVAAGRLSQPLRSELPLIFVKERSSRGPILLIANSMEDCDAWLCESSGDACAIDRYAGRRLGADGRQCCICSGSSTAGEPAVAERRTTEA